MHIFLSNYWWQKSDIWSKASYRYPISWEAFLDPSDSYFLFADFVDFYTHLTYICIYPFLVAFFSATIDGRNLIFGHKLYIGTPYRGKRFLTCQIPTSCLPKSGGIISEHLVFCFFFILFLVCHLLEYCGVIFYSALLLYESYGEVNNVHQTVVQDFPRGGGVGFITVVEFVQSDT
jgi:hypothetical protein